MGFEQEQQLESAYVMPTFARKPVEFVAGRGMELVDSTGKTYLDFLSGIGVDSLGHCPPVLVKTLTDQAEKLIHVSNYYYIEGRGEVAERLSKLLNEEAAQPVQPWKTFFANSGAEANECALKLARLHGRRVSGPEKRIVVTMEKSFHGRTLATLAATAQPVKQELFEPLPDGFVSTPLNDCGAIERLFAQQGEAICAVILEVVQGESGVHPCTEEFIETVRRLTSGSNALMICDEVQSGIFRTGKPFGFQNYNVLPDVVTMAKGIAGGVPMGACAARGELGDTFGPGEHGTTFGGSNLAIAAAAAVLETLDEGGFRDTVKETGAYLRRCLGELPHVIGTRGFGLMVGAELDGKTISAPDAVLAGLEAGLVLNATGPTTLRFLPPLICTCCEVDALVEKLAPVLA